MSTACLTEDECSTQRSCGPQQPGEPWPTGPALLRPPSKPVRSADSATDPPAETLNLQSPLRLFAVDDISGARRPGLEGLSLRACDRDF
jgi:hypothetical protein